MDVSLIKSSMGIQYFQAKLTVILSPIEAVVDYHPQDTRISEYWLDVFSGIHRVQYGGISEMVPLECSRLDERLPSLPSKIWLLLLLQESQ